MLRLNTIVAALVFSAGLSFADWQEVQAIQPGDPILVRAGFITDAGKFVSATSDEVVVETRAGNSTIPRVDIDEVLVMRTQGEKVRRALIFGGIAAGATAGALFPVAAMAARPRYGVAAGLTASNGVVFGVPQLLRGFIAGSRQRRSAKSRALGQVP